MSTKLLAMILFVLVADLMIHALQLRRPQYQYRISSAPDHQVVESLNDAGTRGWPVVSARRAIVSVTKDASYEFIIERETRFLWLFPVMSGE